ncbi:MAG: hypothetical protein LLG00_00420 [Planctomycetaceae bacterium]|nr:hypothetical protein [Planctomycetaceae bacterium]
MSGRRTHCPHCHTAFTAPEIEPSSDSIYDLDRRSLEAIAEMPPEVEAFISPPAEPFEERPILPRHPLLSGTFSFPYSGNARLYLGILAVWAIGALFAARASFEVGEMFGEATLFERAAYTVVSVMLALTWLAFASTCAVSVTLESANACHTVHRWPTLAILEWITDVLYVFDGLCASTLPGVALAWLLRWQDLSHHAVAPLMTFFLFPIVFLSMLEQGSPLGAVSGAVWRTMRVAWKGWVWFYLATAGLLAIAGTLAVAGLIADHSLGLVVCGLVLSATWLTYFRLLGRLAWYCSEYSAIAELEDEEEDGEWNGEATPDADGEQCAMPTAER